MSASECAAVTKAPIFGERGEYPVAFRDSGFSASTLEDVLSIPGTSYTRAGRGFDVRCTWDIADIVGAKLGREPPPLPSGYDIDQTEYRHLGFHKKLRPNQKDLALWGTQRAYGYIGDPMRSGKTLGFLSTTLLVGARRVLIVVPSVVVWNWAHEIARHLHEKALILSGLGGREARLYCTTCSATGQLVDGRECPACVADNHQAYGYTLFDVEELMPETRGPVPHTLVTGPFSCPRHPHMTARVPRYLCPACYDELDGQLHRARFVIVNYELLQGAMREHAGRVLGVDANLKGWGQRLGEIAWDVGAFDEAHSARGWTTSTERAGLSRRDQLMRVFARTRRVFPISGTPMWSHVRDLWGPMNVASKGLFGNNAYVPGKPFMLRYCAGHKGTHGWVTTGESNREELNLRMKYWLIQRTNAELFKHMPPKTRQVIDIEVPVTKLAKVDSAENLKRAQSQLSLAKVEVLAEHFLQYLAEGQKLVVLTYAPEAIEVLNTKIKKLITSKVNRARMTAKNVETWLVLANKPASKKVRDEMAASFREHRGAGIFLSTTGVMQVGISLAGAETIHLIDSSTVPGENLQAEDRIRTQTTPMTAYYYRARGTVDDTVLRHVLGRLSLLDTKTAEELQGTFGQSVVREVLDDVFARHAAGLQLDESSEDAP